VESGCWRRNILSREGPTPQGSGIEPDFTIERTTPLAEQMQWFIKNYGREETLENYIKVNLHGTPLIKNKEEQKELTPKKQGTKRYDRAKEMLQTDNQLRDCITLISMLNSAQKHTPHLVKNRTDALNYLKQNHINSDKLEIEEVTL